MAVKKSELYSSLWKSCDELRGGMDASQYKDYVLVLLFVKYVSDKYAGKTNALIEIPTGGGFKDMITLKGQKDIGDGMNKIIAKLAEANDLKGIIDQTDFNDDTKLGKGKDMVDRLTKLIAIFENEALNFSKNRAEGDDLLGDAYEYLMRHFATESGKSKGQFYTPAEVSRIMAKVIEINKSHRQDQTIYDPTCGSGSLLLKAADESEVGVTIYGQENDNATAALAKMNMILHGNPTAEIHKDNTLSKPFFKNRDDLKTFDYVVANPPFSTKSWSNGFDPANDEFNRFEDGIPPDKNGDYAFFLHIIRSLKSTGKGAVILPHDVLFRGNAEGNIRRNIIKKGYIKGIIGLPANLFYGTGIPACIIVLDKEHAQSRKGIFMIDASKGFVKDGNKNRLRYQDIHKIVDVFNKQLELPKFSRVVSLAEIEKNNYNLNIPRYIDTQEDEDIQDIEAHLQGGIPSRDIEALAKYWEVFPNLRSELFVNGKRANYAEAKVEPEQVRPTIIEHAEFQTYAQTVHAVFTKWRERNTQKLKNIGIGVKPKELIVEISEDILREFTNDKLVDKYDVYQSLMFYWNEVMQDDLYMIGIDGWKAEVYRIIEIKKNKKEVDKGWTCDLVPKGLVMNRYFSEDKTAIENLNAEQEEITRKKEEMEEEHGGDEGAFSSLDKINKGTVKAQMKEIDKNDEEYGVLATYLQLLDEETELKKQIKDVEQALDKKLLNRYKTLTEDEIKTLVVDDKWMTAVHTAIEAEIERISQSLSQRIKELTERYTTPLPQIEAETADLTKKVETHLEKMGFRI
jgi:type I restriction enzyme M protein